MCVDCPQNQTAGILKRLEADSNKKNSRQIPLDVPVGKRDYPIMRVFCVANQKGGVGKTTTAVSLADGLARSGAKTLLADFDPQCNATNGLGCEPLDAALTLSTPPFDLHHNLSLLPGSRHAAKFEVLAQTEPLHLTNVQEQLRTLIADYDYVFFDCPPSLGQLTQLALSVSEEILIPMQCDYYSMIGLAQQMNEVVNIIKNRKENHLQFGGVVLTMYDAGLELTYEVEKEVRDFFGSIVFHTVIPRDAAISESPGHALTIFDYAPRSKGARSYTELCMEIIES